jgi:hypothetical protein
MIRPNRTATPNPIAAARAAYHAAAEAHRGDPTIEATYAVRTAHAILAFVLGVRRG